MELAVLFSFYSWKDCVGLLQRREDSIYYVFRLEDRCEV